METTEMEQTEDGPMDPWGEALAGHFETRPRWTIPPGCVILAVYDRNLQACITLGRANPRTTTTDSMLHQAMQVRASLKTLAELDGSPEVRDHQANIPMGRIALQAGIAALPPAVLTAALTFMGGSPAAAVLTTLAIGAGWGVLQTVNQRRRADLALAEIRQDYLHFRTTAPPPQEPSNWISQGARISSTLVQVFPIRGDPLMEEEKNT